LEVGAGSDEGGIESGLGLGVLFEGRELGVGDVDSAVEDEGAEVVVGDAHLLVAVANDEGDVPRGGEGLGSGGEVGEGEGVEGEVREGGAEDEPGDDEDDAEDDGQAYHGGEEGAEEGAGGVGPGGGVIGVVVLRLGVGRGSGGIWICGGGRRRLSAVVVVEGRSGVAGGGARRILHNGTEQQVT